MGVIGGVNYTHLGSRRTLSDSFTLDRVLNLVHHLLPKGTVYGYQHRGMLLSNGSNVSYQQESGRSKE
jgi:hypothetical protein